MSVAFERPQDRCRLSCRGCECLEQTAGTLPWLHRAMKWPEHAEKTNGAEGDHMDFPGPFLRSETPEQDEKVSVSITKIFWATLSQVELWIFR